MFGLNLFNFVLIIISILYGLGMYFRIYFSSCLPAKFEVKNQQGQTVTDTRERRQLVHEAYETEYAILKQIVFDVSIIIGFANYAVAFQMQRGITWNVVLVSSILLFLTLGFLQHMSNLTRTLQHIALNNGASTDPNVPFFAYNRTIVVAVVALGMLLYMHMASMSYASWNGVVLFGYVHSWIFVAIVFFVFCGFDVGYEIFYHMNTALTKTTHWGVKTPQFVVHKLSVTGIVIMLGIFVLKLHEYSGFCSSLYGRYNEHDPHTYNDNALALRNEDWRQNEMCDRGQFWFAFAQKEPERASIQ